MQLQVKANVKGSLANDLFRDEVVLVYLNNKRRFLRRLAERSITGMFTLQGEQLQSFDVESDIIEFNDQID